MDTYPYLQRKTNGRSVTTPSKRAIMKDDPLLLFDNSSNGSIDIELLTIAETARLFKISETSVRRLQQRMLIPFCKVGGSVRFAKKDVLAYLERRRVVPFDT